MELTFMVPSFAGTLFKHPSLKHLLGPVLSSTPVFLSRIPLSSCLDPLLCSRLEDYSNAPGPDGGVGSLWP